MSLTGALRKFPAGELCRANSSIVDEITSPEHGSALVISACITLSAGAAAYGFVFGYWRGGLQALYSAVKFPLLLLSAVGTSALINAMLAQLMGARLAFRQVAVLMLVGTAITAALLGSLSPVVLFVISQAPDPDPAVLGLARSAAEAAANMAVYRTILLAHVALIGTCGILGNIQLFRILCRLVATRRMAARVLAVWLATSGFVGCELSWLLSPFMCEPVSRPHIVARLYTETNFYEYTGRAMLTLFRTGGKDL